MNLPPVTRSLRFRLSGMTSAVVFGLAGLALGGVYLITLNAIQSLVVTEVVAGEPVLLGGRKVVVPFTAVEMRSFESVLRESLLNHMAYWILLIMLVLFLLSLVVGWIVANRSLKPLDEITLVAREIQATDLDRRIGLVGPDDELTRMASTFDAMLDRLSGSFNSQQRFLAQTSHDLRTPLAVIKSNLEVTASDPNSGIEEWQETGHIVGRAVERMAVMVEDLLAAARLDLGGQSLVAVDLNVVVGEAVEEMTATALAAGNHLVADLDDGPFVIQIDSGMVRRAINNLVDNAFAAGDPPHTVTVATRSVGSWRYIGVVDHGSGINPAMVTGELAGNGLGLSIVRQIVAMHAGSFSSAPNPAGGSILSIGLPASADPEDGAVSASGLPGLYR